MKNKSIKDKYKGETFADAANKIAKKYPNRKFDNTQKNSFEVEMQQLINSQRKAQLQEAIFKNGGTLPKYYNGSPSTLPSANIPDFADLANQGTPDLRGIIQPVEVGDRFIGRDTRRNMKSIKREQRQRNPVSAYTPALVGQGLSTALNAGLLLGGYDQVSPVTNPNASRIENLMAKRSIDNTPIRNQILSAYNAARANIQGVRSSNIENALATNLMNVTQDSLAESKLNQQQINNAYTGEFANVLNNLGQQNVNAVNYAEQLNTQSKDNYQTELSNFGAHLASIGLSQSELNLNTQQQLAVSNILSGMYPDFNISRTAVKNLLTGKYSDEEFIKLQEAAQTNSELKPLLSFIEFQEKEKNK